MKAELRAKFKEICNNNDNYDEIIANNLYHLVKAYQNIAVYLKINNEVNLHYLINKLQPEVNVYVPFVRKNTKILEFRKLDSENNLVLDDAKIPSSSLSNIDINDLDVVILSCLACNLDGYRLGYGGGYYDQTLSHYQGIKVGVVYDNCITNIKFQEHFDIRLDYLVSEKRVIVINKE